MGAGEGRRHGAVGKMSFTIRLRRAARLEFDKAANWYEAQQPGLGAKFTQAVDGILSQIADRPYLHPIIHRDTRRQVVPVFPFCVYYRVRKQEIVVLSIFHTSRDPFVWQSRS